MLTLFHDPSSPPDLDALAELDRLREDAAALGLDLRRPRVIPPTALAHVLMGTAEDQQHPAADRVRRAVYEAVWTAPADIADAAVLTDLAADAGMDRDAVAAVLADRVELAARRRRMTTHRREGVGGVPLILASRTLVPGLLPDDQLRALASST